MQKDARLEPCNPFDTVCAEPLTEATIFELARSRCPSHAFRLPAWPYEGRSPGFNLAYLPAHGVLPRALERSTAQGFRVVNVHVERTPWQNGTADTHGTAASTEVGLSIEGTGDVHRLLTELHAIQSLPGPTRSRSGFALRMLTAGDHVTPAILTL
ncbi:hypothetical protein GCM10022207_86820 [Streptomyces lannensis]|uniref:Uncharacterized protein n=1 Tax=Streptomyces lannensis TaxID=766498 RepID=A0ABP7LNA0_9ACTN